MVGAGETHRLEFPTDLLLQKIICTWNPDNTCLQFLALVFSNKLKVDFKAMADYFAVFHMHLIKTQTTGLSLLLFFFCLGSSENATVNACCYKIYPICLLLTQFEKPCPHDHLITLQGGFNT